MKYGATPLIRMLGPKRRTSGTTPVGPSGPGGVPGPDSPGPEACSAMCGVRLIRRTSAADMLGTDCVSRDRVFMAIFFREVSRLLVSDGGLNELDTESLGFGAGHRDQSSTRRREPAIAGLRRGRPARTAPTRSIESTEWGGLPR